MKTITKLYLINIILLACAAVLSMTNGEEVVPTLYNATVYWIVWTVLAFPVWLIITVITWGKKVD